MKNTAGKPKQCSLGHSLYLMLLLAVKMLGKTQSFMPLFLRLLIKIKN